MQFTPAEHAEIVRLFRSKLASLRAAERAAPRRRTRKLSLPADRPADDALLSSGELAALLGVSPTTVVRWGLPCRRTLGGQRRYRWGDVRAALEHERWPQRATRGR